MNTELMKNEMYARGYYDALNDERRVEPMARNHSIDEFPDTVRITEHALKKSKLLCRVSNLAKLYSEYFYNIHEHNKNKDIIFVPDSPEVWQGKFITDFVRELNNARIICEVNVKSIEEDEYPKAYTIYAKTWREE